MRKERISSFLLAAVLILLCLIAINSLALNIARRQFAPGSSLALNIFDFSGQAREWAEYLIDWKNLAEENKKLNEDLSKSLSNSVIIDSLKSENDSLRKALGLKNRFNRNVEPAGIFDIYLGAQGYGCLINKGASSGIMVGQVVVSLDNELVGRAASVFSDSARVTFLADPSFSVSAKVFGGATSGVAHGFLSNGLSLDLITQSDNISEGDTIVTTGDDMVPSGIVLGSVRHIENNETQLFKKVLIMPAFKPIQGSVLVVK